jgi:uncharacterized damage-inducible protein DinB
MKTTKEYLMGLFDTELPAFIKVIEALPADKLDWKPDPKSATALERASQMASETNDVAAILKDGVVKFDPMTKPTWTTTAEMSAAFSKGFADAKAALAAMSDADWEADAVMMVGGKEAWKTKRGEMALSFMLDLIHHRGQLSVYIRPMGGKVPSIYGPSADSVE